MLNYLKNNFILSALLAIVITIFVYIQKRLDDDRNNKNGSTQVQSNVLFYAKLFIVVYGLVLIVLLFKTRDYTLPFKLKGGSCSVSAPWKEHCSSVSSSSTVQGGGSSNVVSSNTSPTPSVTPPKPVSTSAGTLVEELNLNEVNIGEPNF